MLGDKPDSEGLKDKLAKVRSLAAASETVEDHPSEEGSADLSDPFGIADVGLENQPEAVNAGFDELYAPPGGAATEPSAETDFSIFPSDSSGATPDSDSEQSASPSTDPFQTGFEPAEYRSPEIENTEPVSQFGDENFNSTPYELADEGTMSSPKRTGTGKQEQIVRLEQWLQKIAKTKE